MKRYTGRRRRQPGYVTPTAIPIYTIGVARVGALPTQPGPGGPWPDPVPHPTGPGGPR
jgi:hypothetical protein